MGRHAQVMDHHISSRGRILLSTVSRCEEIIHLGFDATERSIGSTATASGGVNRGVNMAGAELNGLCAPWEPVSSYSITIWIRYNLIHTIVYTEATRATPHRGCIERILAVNNMFTATGHLVNSACMA